MYLYFVIVSLYFVMVYLLCICIWNQAIQVASCITTKAKQAARFLDPREATKVEKFNYIQMLINKVKKSRYKCAIYQL